MGNGVSAEGHGTRILVPELACQLARRISIRQLSEKLTKGTEQVAIFSFFRPARNKKIVPELRLISDGE